MQIEEKNKNFFTYQYNNEIELPKEEEFNKIK